MDKTFQFQKYEKYIYQKWVDKGTFLPSSSGQDNYSIVVPPPNVTGSLHIGHALNNTIQDVLIRYHRMLGLNVLWQCGVDHAGIATQMMVEKQLAKDKLPTRKELGREKFIKKVWQWKQTSGDQISNQMRRLGASCDWSRSSFTMDDDYIKSVNKAFVQLFDEGLIYRAKRLVNWDHRLKTVISDLEVENKEVDGHLWHLKYRIKDSDDYIIVATTRPETYFGDCAVAVHPSDKKYKDIIGKTCILPLTGREIPIITDHYADKNTGSGAVKITPAHDFNDFEVGKRNSLAQISVFNEDGEIVKDKQECLYLDKNGKKNDQEATMVFNSIPQEFYGMEILKARKLLLLLLDESGALVKVEDKKVVIPHGDRSGVIIEPRLIDQWYIDTKQMANNAIKLVVDKKINFVPKNWQKNYIRWLENIQPWCISRQLWWGQQIPAWFSSCGEYIVAINENEAIKKSKEKYGCDIVVVLSPEEEIQITNNKDKVYLQRDKDVLDTWFSSQLWPYATMGWPNKTEDLERFYPTSVLVTAFDILYFWVARMIMSSDKLLGKIPFKQVYIHALVLDEKGQKMSKTKGNVINPIKVIDQYGADALRFSLVSACSHGQDIKLSEDKIIQARNFVTKFWNAASYCHMNGCFFDTSSHDISKNITSTANKWIIYKLFKAIENIEKSLKDFRFNEYGQALYQFIWNDFCDWYIESTKPIYQSGDEKLILETKMVTGFVIRQILITIHPVMPFISEKLYEVFGDNYLLITTKWQNFLAVDYKSPAQEYEYLIDFISEIRSLRAVMGIAPSIFIDLEIIGNEGDYAWLFNCETIFKQLARIGKIVQSKLTDHKKIALEYKGNKFTLLLSDEIDFTKQLLKMEKDIAKLAKEKTSLTNRLANKNFIAKAPEHIIEELHERVEEISIKTLSLQENKLKIESLIS